MMLQAFTWQAFLVAALVLSIVWYAVIGLLFYRREISGFISGRRSEPLEPLPHGWQDEVDDLEHSLIGSQAEEHGVSVVEADDFSFAPRAASENGLDPLGELADVQQEIKSICRILEKEDGSKEDFFSLFAMVRDKYPKVFTSRLLGELGVFIRDHAPFALSEEELDGLWS